MNRLEVFLNKNKLKKHYQKGALRLLALPSSDFFAYLSTLGGGLVNNDKYYQDFCLRESKAELRSQSSQKIYKGKSKLLTNIKLENSKLVFFNDVNIFYEKADFLNSTSIFLDDSSKIFYVDGIFIGLAKGDFSARMRLAIYKNYKLLINDNFVYESLKNFRAFYDYEYFYTLICPASQAVKNIKSQELLAFSTTQQDFKICRILASKNAAALEYLNAAANEFLKEI